jgi:hypothetical protein
VLEETVRVVAMAMWTHGGEAARTLTLNRMTRWSCSHFSKGPLSLWTSLLVLVPVPVPVLVLVLVLVLLLPLMQNDVAQLTLACRLLLRQTHTPITRSRTTMTTKVKITTTLMKVTGTGSKGLQQTTATKVAKAPVLAKSISWRGASGSRASLLPKVAGRIAKDAAHSCTVTKPSSLNPKAAVVEAAALIVAVVVVVVVVVVVAPASAVNLAMRIHPLEARERAQERSRVCRASSFKEATARRDHPVDLLTSAW